MRAVIQRVSHANVFIAAATKASIQRGLLVFLAVEDNDTREDAEWLSGKAARLRIFEDGAGSMNLSVTDVGGEMLVVSQFTLLASTRKGNRPAFTRSAKPEVAIPLYQLFVHLLSQRLGKPVQTGEFGAAMRVELMNDGPVTIIIDSERKE